MSDCCDPMDCSLPGSSVHGILQARILEWFAVSFSRKLWLDRPWLYFTCRLCCCLIAKSCPTLWPHELQHTRLSCPSVSSGVCSDSCNFSKTCVRLVLMNKFLVALFMGLSSHHLINRTLKQVLLVRIKYFSIIKECWMMGRKKYYIAWEVTSNHV